MFRQRIRNCAQRPKLVSTASAPAMHLCQERSSMQKAHANHKPRLTPFRSAFRTGGLSQCGRDKAVHLHGDHPDSRLLAAIGPPREPNLQRAQPVQPVQRLAASNWRKSPQFSGGALGKPGTGHGEHRSLNHHPAGRECAATQRSDAATEYCTN